MSNALPLPWPYLPGDAAPGSFEDRVQANMDALAIAVGGSPLVALGGTVTSLPTAPFNGQEISYLADATNGIVWRLKYRTASASTYKWEFIGGGQLSAFLGIEQAIASGSSAFQDPATAGPSITVPLAGDYVMDGACYMIYTAASTGRVGVKVGSGDVDANSEMKGSNVAGGAVPLPIVSAPITGIAASTILKMQYASDSTVAAAFGLRRLSVTPVRVG